MNSIVLSRMTLLVAGMLSWRIPLAGQMRSDSDSPRILSMACAGASTVFTAGERGMVRFSSDGGLTWHQSETGTSRTIRKITFLDSERGVAVGDSGSILMTYNKGRNWQSRITEYENDLFGVSMVDERHFFVVGRRGTILRSTDANTTWQAMTSGTYYSLRSIAAVDSMNIVVVGIEGTILSTSDGGVTWRHRFSGTMNDLNDVAFVGGDLGVAIGGGGTIVRTTDAGATWTPIQNSFDADLVCVKYADGNIAVAVAANGSIVRSTDGGGNWVVVREGGSIPLSGISFANAMNGLVAGENGLILRTDDAGAHWMENLLTATRIAEQQGGEKMSTVVRKPDPKSEKDQPPIDHRTIRHLPRSEHKAESPADPQMKFAEVPIALWKPFDLKTMFVQVPAGYVGGFGLGLAGLFIGQAIDSKSSVAATVVLGGAGALFGIPLGVWTAGKWMGGNGTYASTLQWGYGIMLGGILLTAVVPPIGVVIVILAHTLAYHFSASPVYQSDSGLSLGWNPGTNRERTNPGHASDFSVNVISLTL